MNNPIGHDKKNNKTTKATTHTHTYNSFLFDPYLTKQKKVYYQFPFLKPARHIHHNHIAIRKNKFRLYKYFIMILTRLKKLNGALFVQKISFLCICFIYINSDSRAVIQDILNRLVDTVSFFLFYFFSQKEDRQRCYFCPFINKLHATKTTNF